MTLHAEQFFTRLALPFPDSTVIGDTYRATPEPGSATRVRITFHPTIRIGEYDGLQLRLIHPHHGTIDSQVLTFADHATFAHRDHRQGRTPRTDGHATIRDWHPTGPTPWAGADLTNLRTSIVEFVQLWFPRTTRTSPTRTTTPAHNPPTPGSTPTPRAR